MEHKVNIMEPEQLIPSLLALLEETDAVPLVITGGSMTPFLVHGRDTVYLSKIATPPKRGDMILYQRDNGRFILHRVYRVGTTYTMVGDAQTLLETGIRPDQMLARVDTVRRKGKLLRKGNFCWDFFEKVWIRLIPFRSLFRKVYAIVWRLKRICGIL
jgi:hypothetical protein